MPNSSGTENTAAYTGRLAPSPTGLLHLGHVRTFAMAQRRALEEGGVLRLRVDDLDKARCRPEYVAAALQDLGWLGLDWTGKILYQSERTEQYRKAWRQLVSDGWLYPCRCSRRELAAMVAAPHEAFASPESVEEPVYPGVCRPRWRPGEESGAEERSAWLAAGPMERNWRFRVPEHQTVAIADGGFGLQQFVAGRDFGDFLVWRRDDVPAYQLATVVDDAEMGITEVVRGADLLLSTARQILLFRALGMQPPRWFHCALVRDARGQRLAKRTDALAVCTLRERGLTVNQVLQMVEQLPAA